VRGSGQTFLMASKSSGAFRIHADAEALDGSLEDLGVEDKGIRITGVGFRA